MKLHDSVCVCLCMCMCVFVRGCALQSNAFLPLPKPNQCTELKANKHIAPSPPSPSLAVLFCDSGGRVERADPTLSGQAWPQCSAGPLPGLLLLLMELDTHTHRHTDSGCLNTCDPGSNNIYIHTHTALHAHIDYSHTFLVLLFAYVSFDYSCEMRWFWHLM